MLDQFENLRVLPAGTVPGLGPYWRHARIRPIAQVQENNDGEWCVALTWGSGATERVHVGEGMGPHHPLIVGAGPDVTIPKRPQTSLGFGPDRGESDGGQGMAARARGDGAGR